MDTARLDAVDDLAVEVSADEAYVVTVVGERDGQSRAGLPRSENGNSSHRDRSVDEYVFSATRSLRLVFNTVALRDRGLTDTFSHSKPHPMWSGCG